MSCELVFPLDFFFFSFIEHRATGDQFCVESTPDESDVSNYI